MCHVSAVYGLLPKRVMIRWSSWRFVELRNAVASKLPDDQFTDCAAYPLAGDMIGSPMYTGPEPGCAYVIGKAG